MVTNWPLAQRRGVYKTENNWERVGLAENMTSLVSSQLF